MGKTNNKKQTNQYKLATFGAGCFWGVEERFRQTPGVASTRVGYMGGDKEDPTYEEVCSGITGHTEVVEVTYDPEKTNYDNLLNVFFAVHDPTQVNRQGPDVGYQYRSVIFYHDNIQKELAEEAVKTLEETGRHDKHIATAVEPVGTFWMAEDYHQQYVAKQGGRGATCPA